MRQAERPPAPRLVHDNDPEVAEFATVVQHGLRSRGFAVHLAERLLVWADRDSAHDVIASIVAEDTAMLDLARFLCRTLRRTPTDPQVAEAYLSPNSFTPTGGSSNILAR